MGLFAQVVVFGIAMACGADWLVAFLIVWVCNLLAQG